MIKSLVLFDIQADLLERFGNAGLVFLVMALVIYFLFKEYKTEKKEKKEATKELSDYLKNKQAENIEMMQEFENILNNIVQHILEIKQKLNK